MAAQNASKNVKIHLSCLLLLTLWLNTAAVVSADQNSSVSSTAGFSISMLPYDDDDDDGDDWGSHSQVVISENGRTDTTVSWNPRNLNYDFNSTDTSLYDITNNGTAQEKIPLFLGGYFSLGGVWDGSGILPAVEMALDHINERTDILPEYELKMVWNDTQCDSGLGTRMLFDQVFHEPQKIVILGPPCSTDAQSIADASHYWNLISVSYSAASPALSNRQKYPYFYRTNMNALSYNPTRVRMIREMKWKRVASIVQNHEVFALTFEDLFMFLRESNITIISAENFDKNPTNQVQNLKNHDAKIIFVDMFENMARQVFCEAYKLGMTDESYVWFIPAWYTDKWWAVEDNDIRCTVEELTEALVSSTYLTVSNSLLSTKQEPTVSGMTPQQYVHQLQERMKWPQNEHYSWNEYAPYGYDATWAIALMLNKSTDFLKGKVFSDGKKHRLEDFKYDNSEMVGIFLDQMSKTDFIGVSGPVSFNDGDRIGVTAVEQVRFDCEKDWHLYNGQCFSFVMEEYAFAEAEEVCRKSDGQLAVIADTEEVAFLAARWGNLNATSPPMKWLIGLIFDDSSDDYIWLRPPNTTQYLTWQPEGSLLPKSGRPGDCVYMDFTEPSTRWVATSCNTSRPFICQKDRELFKHLVALYTAKDNVMDWQRDIVWKGGKVPLDHTPRIVINTTRYHTGIRWLSYTVMCILAGMGILLAFFFFGFNIKYRKQRFVKMSSPNLNNIIILGSILVYLSVIAGGLDSNTANRKIQNVACQVRVWLLSIGFVLAFGSMFSKTWRVYRVAALKTPKRRIITDGHLLIMVFVFFCVDLCVLISWQIIDPIYVKTIELYERNDPVLTNQRIIPYIEQCISRNHIYWLVPLCSYKGLLLIFGTFLAWETRKVTFPALNDSKLIGICVYNTVVLCIVGVSVTFIITNDMSVLFIFTSSIVIFCATLTLLVIFIPKIISVHKYPDGAGAISSVKGNDTGLRKDATSTNLTNEENKKLRTKIIKLERELRKQHNAGVLSVSHGTGSKKKEHSLDIGGDVMGSYTTLPVTSKLGIDTATVEYYL